MAKDGGQIRFGVRFDVDQSSLSQIKSELKAIQNLTTKDLFKIDSSLAEKELSEIKQAASELQKALQSAFNTDLGTLNIDKFNSKLKELDLNSIQSKLAQAGAVGRQAFQDIAVQTLTTNMQLKQTNNFLEQISVTMANTIKWGVASSIMNSFTGSVQEAVGYIKALDASLTDIRIVTGKSKDEMANFAVQANDAAAALGRQTKEYTQAALTFYQQGLNDADVQKRTEAVLKASNITNESVTKMSEYLTAVWNGFQVSLKDTEVVVDKLAAVADTSASDMSELATAMSKVASSANSMGVDIDQLSAQIATIVATTRQAPEAVGNALKTIYARIADIKAGTEESGVTLGNYSGKMAQLGINVLDSAGNLRDMGEVIEEIGGKWETLSREQQVYLTQTMAGQRQYNNLMALFENWKLYTDELNVSLEAQGALDQKNAVYMESLAAKTKQLTAAKENLIDSLADGDGFKGVIDGLTVTLNLMTHFIDSIGGGRTALLSLVPIASTVFQKHLAQGITAFLVNLKNAQENTETFAAKLELLKRYNRLDDNTVEFQKLLDMEQSLVDLNKVLTIEEQNQGNELIRMTNEVQKQEAAWKNNVKVAEDFLDRVSKANQQEGYDPERISSLMGKFGISNQNSQDNLKELNQIIKEEGFNLKDTQHDIEEWRKTLDNSANTVRATAQDLKQLKEENKDTTDAEKSHKAALTDLTQIVKQFNQELLQGANATRFGDRLKELQKAYENYNTALQSGSYEAAIRKARVFMTVVHEAVADLQAEGQQAQEAIKGALNNVETEIENKAASIKTAFDQLINIGKLREKVQDTVKIVGAVGQVTAAISSVSHAFAIMQDESLSSSEKFFQVVTNLGFSIPMLATAFGTLKTAMGATSSILDVIKTKMAASKAAQDAVTLATQRDMAVEKAREAQLKATNLVQAQAHGIKVSDAEITKVCTEANMADAAASEADAAAKEQEAISTQAAKNANDALNASLLKSPLFWVAVSGLAIWGIVSAFDAFTMSVEEATEAVDKFNQTEEESQRKMADYSKNVSSLKEIEKEYDKLSAKAGDYDATIENLTEEERNRYNELKNLIVQYNEDAIVGYNEQGEAILRNNDALRETIELLEQKRQLEIEQTYGGEEFQEAQRGKGVLLEDANKAQRDSESTLSRTENAQTELKNKVYYVEQRIKEEGKVLNQKQRAALDELNKMAQFSEEDFAKRYKEISDKYDTFIDETIGEERNIQRKINGPGAPITISEDAFAIDFEGYAKAITNLEKAENKIAELDKFDFRGEVLGFLETDANDDEYNRLKELGIKDINTILEGYVEGIKRSDFEGDGQQQISGLIDEIRQQEVNLLAALEEDPSLLSKIENAAKSFNNQVFSAAGEYNAELQEELTKIYRNNPALQSLPNQLVESIFENDFGLSDVDVSSSKFVLAFSNIFEDSMQQIQEKIKSFSGLDINPMDLILNQSLSKGQMSEFAAIISSDLENLGNQGGFAQMAKDLNDAGISVNFMAEAWQRVIHESGTYEQFLDNISGKTVHINAIMADLASGKKLNTSELEELKANFEEVYGATEDLVNLYPELGEAAKNAFDPELNGTGAQLVALQALEEKIEEISLEKLITEFGETAQELDKLQQSYSTALEGPDKTQLKKQIDDTLEDLVDQDYQVQVALIADLKSDVANENKVREWIDSIQQVAAEGAEATSKEWQACWEALQANSDAFYEKTQASIIDAFEYGKDGIIQFKNEYLDEINDILQQELANSQASVEGEISAIRQKLSARAKAAAAESAAAAEYATALENEAAAQEALAVAYESGNSKKIENAKADVENARTVTNEKKKVWDTESGNLKALMESEASNFVKMIDNAETASNAEQEAAKNVADTSGSAANSIATSWSNLAQSASDSAKAYTSAIASMAQANKAFESGGTVTVFGKGLSGGAKSVAGGAVTTKTKSGSSANIKLQGEKAETKTAESNADAVSESFKELAEGAHEAAAYLRTQASMVRKHGEAIDAKQKQYEKALGELAVETAKHNAAQNGGGGGSGKGGGGGKKGKGGGGKKGKAAKEPKAEKEEKPKEPDHMDLFNDEELEKIENRFHDIDAEIQKLNKDLDKLAKLQNRYLGSALVHNLNQQLKILKKQKGAYQEKLKMAKEELKNQRDRLQAQGVEIGKDGQIKNYTDALKQKQEQLNGLVNKYNNATAEGQENLKGQVDAQKKSYDELKQQMSAYEQLNGQTIPDIEAQLAAIEEMIIELQIEKFNAVIVLHVDWQQFQEEYRELQKSLAEFHSQFATMMLDINTNTITRNSTIEGAARQTAQIQRTADQNAAKQEDAAAAKYKADKKRLRSRKGREELAAEYGFDLSSKSSRKEFKKWLANNFQDTLEEINDEKLSIYDKAQIQYYKELTASGGTHSAEQQAQLQQDLDLLNTQFNDQRQKLDNDYQSAMQQWKRRKKDNIEQISIGDQIFNVDEVKNRKEFSRLIARAYEESIAAIEDMRNQNIKDTIDAYNSAADQIGEHSTKKLFDFGATYINQMKEIKKASDQIINGDIMATGGRTTSILDDMIDHGEQLARRIESMNNSTRIDKQGNKIMGTDSLKVGDTDPTTGEVIQNKKQLRAVKKKIGKDKSGEVYADMQSKIVEDGKQRAQEIQDIISQLQDQIQQAFDLWYEAIDKQKDLIDDIMDDYSFIDDLYNDQLKVLELIGQEESDQYNSIKKAQNQQRETELAYLAERRQKAKENFEAEATQMGINSEAYTKYYEEWKDLTKQYYDLQIQQIEEVKEEAFKAMDDILKAFDKKFANGLGLDFVKQSWNDITELADLYLDDIDKAYEIQKLRAQYEETLNKATDSKQQDKIREIMEARLKILQESEYLSEAEVQHEQDLYNVMVKQIALEEAQQNKNKLKLRRDSQGNYNYQFVANQEQVDSKEQDLLNALKQMNDNSESARRENDEARLEALYDVKDRIEDLTSMFRDGEITQEQFETELQKINEFFGNVSTILDSQAVNLAQAVNESQFELLQGMVDTEGFQQMATDMNLTSSETSQLRAFMEQVMSGADATSLFDLLKGDTSELIEQANANHNEIFTSLDGFIEAYNSGSGEYARSILDSWSTVIDNVGTLISDLGTESQEVQNAINNATAELKGNIDEDIKTANEHIDSTTAAVNNMDKDIAELREQAKSVQIANELAISNLQITLNNIYDQLMRMMNEGDKGSETGKVQKNARASFGISLSNMSDEQKQALAKENTENAKAKVEEANAKSFSTTLNQVKAQGLTEDEIQKALTSKELSDADRAEINSNSYIKNFVYRSLAKGNSITQALKDARVAYDNEVAQVADAIDPYKNKDWVQMDLTPDQIYKKSTGTATVKLTSKQSLALAEANKKPGLFVIDKKKAKNGRAHVSANGVKLGWVDLAVGEKAGLLGYSTGGYTGDWPGNGGRLALLHKKEMVLNESDTVRMLDAVQLANSVATRLQTLGTSALSQLNSNVNNNLLSPNSADAIEQTVTINATFPNATNQNEIKEALMNLVNVAAQKASPNRRRS